MRVERVGMAGFACKKCTARRNALRGVAMCTSTNEFARGMTSAHKAGRVLLILGRVGGKTDDLDCRTRTIAFDRDLSGARINGRDYGAQGRGRQDASVAR